MCVFMYMYMYTYIDTCIHKHHMFIICTHTLIVLDVLYVVYTVYIYIIYTTYTMYAISSVCKVYTAHTVCNVYTVSTMYLHCIYCRHHWYYICVQMYKNCIHSVSSCVLYALYVLACYSVLFCTVSCNIISQHIVIH